MLSLHSAFQLLLHPEAGLSKSKVIGEQAPSPRENWLATPTEVMTMPRKDLSFSSFSTLITRSVSSSRLRLFTGGFFSFSTAIPAQSNSGRGMSRTHRDATLPTRGPQIFRESPKGEGEGAILLLGATSLYSSIPGIHLLTAAP